MTAAIRSVPAPRPSSVLSPVYRPSYVGRAGADTLNRLLACDAPTCDRTCRWEADPVGGAVTRLHGRRYMSGIVVSEIEYPPGDSRSDGPAVYLPEADDGLTLAQAARVAADLLDAAMGLRGRGTR